MRMLGEHPHHVVGKKYADGVRLAGCVPLAITTAQEDELDALLDRADGVFLTGSPSNVHPRHFGDTVHDESLPLDPDRDAWTLPLIPKVIERGMPLFAVCRGFQETNVALGGTLHQAVHELPAHLDHRAPANRPAATQYAAAHSVQVVRGGRLSQILGQPCLEVNSVHGQGVNQLAPGLRVEASAPDGLVEAFSVADAPGFTLCVQWHPEWQAAENPVSVQLFKAFGLAAKAYRDSHRDPPGT